jgi:hypothetical protein
MRPLPGQPVACAKKADVPAQFAPLTLRSAVHYATQTCGRHGVLTAARNASRDMANCSVGIVVGRPGNRFAGARVASHKPRKRDNRLVPDLGGSIAGQYFNENNDNVGDADIPFTAPLTDETV